MVNVMNRVQVFLNSYEFELLKLDAGTKMFRSMPPTVTYKNWKDWFTNKQWPAPTWYASKETAEQYARDFGEGTIMEFETIAQETLLFILSDYNNIQSLMCLLNKQCASLKARSTAEAIRAIRIAVGANLSCKKQAEAVQAYDYPMRQELPDIPGKLKRCSIHEIDTEMTVTICEIFKDLKCAGYFADEMPTAFGNTAPLFHSEYALCYAPKTVRPVLSESDMSSRDSAVPELMYSDSGRFFERLVTKERAFSNIIGLQSEVSKIINKLMLDFLMVTNYKGAYAIGGGFAWTYWFENTRPAPKLSTADLRLLAAGYGWHYYFFRHEGESPGNIICQTLYDTIVGITKAIGGINVFQGYKVVIDSNLKISKKQCKRDPNDSLLWLSIVLVGGTDFKDLEIFRVEEIFLPKVDLQRFTQLFISHPIRILNAHGLWIMNEMFGNSTNNWLNTVYHNMYTRYLLEQNATTEVELLVRAYTEVFKPSPLYDVDLINNMMVKILQNQNNDAKELLGGIFDRWIIKRMRPYINHCIANIDRELATQNKGAFIMIAGGDAMRRYKFSSTVTRDIDTKLFIPQSLKKIDRKAIHDIVRKTMSQLVTHLIRNKSEILRTNFDTETFNTMDGSMYIEPIYDSLQFRLRFIESHASFPVDLYSVDYRARIRLLNKVSISYDIPVLDVVLLNMEKGVSPVRFHGLPVASLDFLVHDLQTTYTNQEMAKFRYLGQKNKKDMERYITLRGIEAPSASNAQYTTLFWEESTKKDLDRVETYDDDPGLYYGIFERIMGETKDKSQVKYKVPFDKNAYGLSELVRKRGRSQSAHSSEAPQRKK
jgi:hypothetical protein